MTRTLAAEVQKPKLVSRGEKPLPSGGGSSLRDVLDAAARAECRERGPSSAATRPANSFFRVLVWKRGDICSSNSNRSNVSNVGQLLRQAAAEPGRREAP